MTVVMVTEDQSRVRATYREARFFCRKMRQADDGHRRRRGHSDAEEFRFYCSAFDSAVADLHRLAEQADSDAPTFTEWADDDRSHARHDLFEDVEREGLIVARRRKPIATDAIEDEEGGAVLVPSGDLHYCVPRDADEDPPLGAEHATGDTDGVALLPVVDLAAAYLDDVDEWLTARETADDVQ